MNKLFSASDARRTFIQRTGSDRLTAVYYLPKENYQTKAQISQAEIDEAVSKFGFDQYCLQFDC